MSKHTRPRVVDGGDGLKIWRVAANVLDKESRTERQGAALQLGRGGGGLGEGLNNSP
jgi:hypothetical protein